MYTSKTLLTRGAVIPLCTFVLLFQSACLWGPIPEIPQNSGAGSIAGRILDDTGQPIANAAVHVLPELYPPDAQPEAVLANIAALEQLINEGSRLTRSSSDGHFEISDLERRTYTIRVLASGLSAVEIRGVRTPKEDLAIALSPGAAFTCTVRRVTDGEPIGGALVSAYRAMGESTELTGAIHDVASPPIEQRTTASDGTCRFEHLGADLYNFSIQRPRYQPHNELRIALATGEEVHRDFALENGKTLRGHVKTSRGEPVKDATVTIIPEISRQQSPRVALGLYGNRVLTTTDAAGIFKFNTLGDEKYVVSVWHPDLVAADLQGIRAGSDTLEIMLESGASVVGLVQKRLGRTPIAGAVVSIRDRMGHRKEATTDDNGLFEIKGLDSDLPDMVAEVRARGFGMQRRRLNINHDEVFQHRFTLMPRAFLFGKIVHVNQLPVFGARVGVYTIDPDSRSERLARQTRTDEEGTYSIENVEPLELVRVRITFPGHLPASSDSFKIEAGAEVSVPIIELQPTATLVGRVMDSHGKTVSALSLEMEEKPAVNIDTRIDPDGRFTLRGLPPGTCRLRIKAPGLTGRTINVTIATGGQYDLGQIVLNQGEAIGGRIIDTDKKPIAGARIIAAADREDEYLETLSGENGSFKLAGFLPGAKVKLQIHHPDHGALQMEVPAGSLDLDFTLKPLGVLTGKVINSTGRPAVLLTVEPVPVNERGTELDTLPRPGKKIFETSDGSFTYQGIPAGLYTIKIRSRYFDGVNLGAIKISENKINDLRLVHLDKIAVGPGISGIILDGKNPIKGATIRIIDNRPVFPMQRYLKRVTTAADGLFGIRHLGKRKLTLELTHPRYRKKVLEDVDTESKSSHRLEITLERLP